MVLGQVITKGAGMPNLFFWDTGEAGAITCELLAEFPVMSWAASVVEIKRLGN